MCSLGIHKLAPFSTHLYAWLHGCMQAHTHGACSGSPTQCLAFVYLILLLVQLGSINPVAKVAMCNWIVRLTLKWYLYGGLISLFFLELWCLSVWDMGSGRLVLYRDTEGWTIVLHGLFHCAARSSLWIEVDDWHSQQQSTSNALYFAVESVNVCQVVDFLCLGFSIIMFSFL